jgi:ribosomal protein S18 acetylase RimI-like enzyme
VSPPQPVRRATPADVRELARTLAAAFRGNPWTRWTIDEDDHERRVRETYEVVLGQLALPFGEVWTTDDRAAVSAWAGAGGDGELARALARVESQTAALAGRRAEAAAATAALLAERRPARADCYLTALGVRPERQGQGLGSAALAPGLARCDAEGQCAALDTSDPANLDFHARHGFHVVDEFELPDGGPRMWVMLREPRT